MLVIEQKNPGARRRKPGIRTRSVDRLVPSTGERLLSGARGLSCDGDVDAAVADHRATAFELVGELHQEA